MCVVRVYACRYVDVVLQLLERSGDFVGDDIWHRAVQVRDWRGMADDGRGGMRALWAAVMRAGWERRGWRCGVAAGAVRQGGKGWVCVHVDVGARRPLPCA